MNPTRETPSMNEGERAEWHDAHAGEPRTGLVIKRLSSTTADAHLSVRLYEHQIRRLQSLSVIEGRSVSALVRQIVEQELDRRLPLISPTKNSFEVFFIHAAQREPAWVGTGSAVPDDLIDRDVEYVA